MAPPISVRVIDRCRIAPPPGSVAATTLPLTFFDIPWLVFSPSQPLFFFHLPIHASHFISKPLSNLKHSLSLSLQHYFPFSGRLNPSDAPEIVYNENDSVEVTVAEADGDFHYLCSHQRKDASEFHDLVPELDDVSMMAVQITVFSNAGFSIGLALHHAVADGRTFTNFVKLWSSICRHGDKIPPNSLPYLDRSVISDPSKVKALMIDQWKKQEKCLNKNMDDMNRATFVMSSGDMEKIEHLIRSICKRKSKACPQLLSPYVLTCSYVWVCLSESRQKNASENEKDLSFFGFNAGGITRLDYTVPAGYLGNCVAFGRAVAGRRELTGNEGIVVAAEAIGRKIKELDKEVLGGVEKWISEWEVLFGCEENVMVFGSPKLNLYEVDFGWGRPKKIEEISISIGGMKSGISLTDSRDIKGGIEIGLVLPRIQMEAFSSLFHEGLEFLP